MKRSILFISILVCIVYLGAADIHSTAAGGNWSNPNTWVGGIVPSSGDNVWTYGTVYVDGSKQCHKLINQGILKSPYVSGISHTLTVNERLENHGTIQNSGYNLYVIVKGDLYNYGEIKNNKIEFQGSNTHNIWQSRTASRFNCQYFEANSDSGPLQLTSNISFLNSTINLRDATFNLHDLENGFTISLNGGWLSNANIQGGMGACLNLSGNEYLNNLTINEVIFAGLVQIYGANVVVDRLINQGILKSPNISGINSMLTVNERLENHGIIQNSGYNLSVTLNGDLYNYGTLRNQFFNIQGVEDQYLLMAPGSVQNCHQFNLFSNVGSALWFFNGSQSSTDYQTQITINTTQHGVWRHHNEDGLYGRNITINSGTGGVVSQPQNLNISRNLDQLRLQWNEVTNASFYKIYTASVPEGPWTLLSIAHDYNPGDGIVFWNYYPTERHRFFKVTAQN